MGDRLARSRSREMEISDAYYWRGRDYWGRMVTKPDYHWKTIFQLERFERLEDTALLESALWKLKIHEWKALHGHHHHAEERDPKRARRMESSSTCEDPTDLRMDRQGCSTTFWSWHYHIQDDLDSCAIILLSLTKSGLLIYSQSTCARTRVDVW
jgi:hypothetical protein